MSRCIELCGGTTRTLVASVDSPKSTFLYTALAVASVDSPKSTFLYTALAEEVRDFCD
ncbi:hypothetical protein KSB_57380 [Ktedonobacter robiniae]|uniref:KaiC-like domain-containing protein n=1 Tax=Ktedonobacter robiniae TaxID=2778365 RepID=A0ABQ3UX65_9CHLR|nr:hypothetical protein KSB_57380 [Ktedonobacter robiniae]